VFAEDEADLLVTAAGTAAELADLVDRRADGVPLEHLLGWAQFCGLRIAVGPGVFVPRRRTELLVREAAALAPVGAVVVDLCCGSGAVAAALHASRPDLDLYAVDIDPVAVGCARQNLPAGVVVEGDLFGPLPEALRGRVDVVVSNTPYVPTQAIGLMPPEARLHEPLVALDGGSDGLDVQRRVAAEAPRWLRPDGQLLVETSEEQAARSAALLARHGLVPTVARCEELDAVAVIGSRAGAA
jgi:release factor glutamine methyltransferase